ncbi:MAG: hypothetical protein KIS62_12250 [Ramlibacter sp.]|nr:hypothetical protein [Ramlibacter sp.]MCW5650509.1 hypothetical protein [Ramlibacter sp.]
MTLVQIELWQLVLLLVAFFAACAAAGKLLLDQTQRHLDERFSTQELARATQHEQLAKRLDSMEQVNREETLQWQRVEREMLKFQAEMPMNYVMRDDYIRGQSIIEAKLDGLADKIEKAQLRAVINGGKA